MSRLSQLGVAGVVIVVAVTLTVAGCGGGSTGDVTATMGGGSGAANPAMGTYLAVCREGAIGTGFVVLRVDRAGSLSAVAKLLLRGKSSGTGTVTGAGVANWTVSGKDQSNQVVTVSFTGDFSNTGTLVGNGTWTASSGQHGDWVAQGLEPLPKAGSWTAEASTGDTKLPWTQAYAFLGRDGADEYLNIVFEGTRTALPCEALVTIKNPRKVALNTPTDVFGMDLVLANSFTGWRMDYLQDKPKLTFTQRNLGVGGSVSGTISGKLYRGGFTQPVELKQAAFRLVKMITPPAFPALPLALPPTNLLLSPGTDTISLGWTAPTGTTLTILRYQIERSVDATPFERIDTGNVGFGSTSFKDYNTVSGRHAYQYRMRTLYTNGAVSPYAISGAIFVTR